MNEIFGRAQFAGYSHFFYGGKPGVADELATRWSLPKAKSKYRGLLTDGRTGPGGPRVAILKPMTYMNEAGDSVSPARGALKVDDLDHVLVIHDEIDLPFGDVRVKVGGGHAGHNGLRSIIERTSSPDFVRVRIGVGRPPPGFSGDVADYVLSGFDPVERVELPSIVSRAVRAAKEVLSSGAQAAMNQVNVKTK